MPVSAKAIAQVDGLPMVVKRSGRAHQTSDVPHAQDTKCTNFLELGAGKAYLACMLAEAFPVQHLVLVDSQSFKLQADRYLLRQSSQPTVCLCKAQEVWECG